MVGPPRRAKKVLKRTERLVEKELQTVSAKTIRFRKQTKNGAGGHARVRRGGEDLELQRGPALDDALEDAHERVALRRGWRHLPHTFLVDHCTNSPGP